jgi:amino acid transporter
LSSIGERSEAVSTDQTYGLRRNVLTPIQTLAQSISTIAPTCTPTINIPLVFALAGNGTWLVYCLALAGILLIAACVSKFAGYSASPGSLYKYASDSLPPWVGTLTAWSLLLAYVETGSSVAGGFVHYAQVLLPAASGHGVLWPSIWGVVVVGAAVAFACREVEISTRMMLCIEGVSVLSVSIVLGLVLFYHGVHIDTAQLHLQGVTPAGVRIALVLAVFSSVSFDSAATLAHEVKDPLRTIPRVLMLSTLLTGAFFVLSAYTETLGFHDAGADLGSTEAPMRVLATLVHLPALGVIIDVGLCIGLFACTLACITAAARIMLLMSHKGIAHKWLLRGTKTEQHAPVDAVLVTGALVMLPVAGLTLFGANGFDIYGWMGSMAVYGFLTAYALVCLALPVFLKRRNELSIGMILLPAAAVIAILLALVGTLYPVPAPPYNRLPYVYLVTLAIGLVSSWVLRKKKPAA